MTDSAAKPAISFKEFLENVPPGTTKAISDLGGKQYQGGPTGLTNAEICLHCDSESCGGLRLFSIVSEPSLNVQISKLVFVSYRCKNCSANTKTFALWLKLGLDRKNGDAYKYGEAPEFGPPTPSRVISLIGPQKDMFLKGRRSENQGLGIAAFAYYRRVIEGQKDRIFDEIIKVCRRLSVDKSAIDELIAAKNEPQFSKAVEAVKHGIPQALLINGHNPLTLLHSALPEAGLAPQLLRGSVSPEYVASFEPHLNGPVRQGLALVEGICKQRVAVDTVERNGRGPDGRASLASQANGHYNKQFHAKGKSPLVGDCYALICPLFGSVVIHTFVFPAFSPHERRKNKRARTCRTLQEAPRSALGENAPSRADWRALGLGLSCENSRFS
jgi:hypothetical protein